MKRQWNPLSASCLVHNWSVKAFSKCHQRNETNGFRIFMVVWVILLKFCWTFFRNRNNSTPGSAFFRSRWKYGSSTASSSSSHISGHDQRVQRESKASDTVVNSSSVSPRTRCKRGASVGCDYCLQNFMPLLLSGNSSVPCGSEWVSILAEINYNCFSSWVLKKPSCCWE